MCLLQLSLVKYICLIILKLSYLKKISDNQKITIVSKILTFKFKKIIFLIVYKDSGKSDSSFWLSYLNLSIEMSDQISF